MAHWVLQAYLAQVPGQYLSLDMQWGFEGWIATRSTLLASLAKERSLPIGSSPDHECMLTDATVTRWRSQTDTKMWTDPQR